MFVIVDIFQCPSDDGSSDTDSEVSNHGDNDDAVMDGLPEAVPDLARDDAVMDGLPEAVPDPARDDAVMDGLPEAVAVVAPDVQRGRGAGRGCVEPDEGLPGVLLVVWVSTEALAVYRCQQVGVSRQMFLLQTFITLYSNLGLQPCWQLGRSQSSSSTRSLALTFSSSWRRRPT